MSSERIAGVGAFALVIAGLAAGFGAIGPPQHVRLVELDRRRVSDLQMIDGTVRFDVTRRPVGSEVPARYGETWPRDPLTGQMYGYRRENATRYVLCATFALPSDGDAVETRWRHGAGRTCYREDRASGGRPENAITRLELR